MPRRNGRGGGGGGGGGDAVRLEQPRPDVERLRNDYTDMARSCSNSTASSSSSEKKMLQSSSSSTPKLPLDLSMNNRSIKLDLDRVVGGKAVVHNTRRTARRRRFSNSDLDCSEKNNGKHRTERRAQSVPIAKQQPQRVEIICRECGRCRCSECARPRYLPETWICNDSCLLSTSSILDVISCMCCYRALQYHCCTKGSRSTKSSMSIGNTKSRSEWLCLVLTSLCLPCLCCYWPLRICEKAVQGAYRKAHDRACHCNRIPSTGDNTIITVQPRLGGGLAKPMLNGNSKTFSRR